MSTGLLAKLRRRRGSPADPVPPADVLARIRTLELRTRGFVESLFSGEYLSVFLGRGMEFSHVRGYQFGDDVRAIDWKVTARRGTPYVRQFIEERDLLVVLVVDVSASGRFGAGARSSAEVAAEIAAALTFAATRSNDRLALVLTTDRVEAFVPPGSGRRHAIRLLSTLLTVKPRSRGTDLRPALEHLTRVLPGRATVFVVSDFIQSADRSDLEPSLARAARIHDLVAIRLSSGAVDALPNVGWIELDDPESGKRVLVNSSREGVRRRYAHAVRAAAAETDALLDRAGVEVVDIDTSIDPLAGLTRFFRNRRAAPR